MKSTPRKTHPLLIIGLIALMSGIICDSYLHADRAVTIGILLVAIVCMILGLQAMRNTPAALRLARPPPRRKLAMIIPAAFIGT